MKRILTVFPIILFVTTLCNGQVKVDPWKVYRGKYCFYKKTKQFIGDTVKVWSEGGHYPKFNQSETFNWAPDSLKAKCDGSYSPIDGELGIVRFVSPVINDRRGIDNLIYIIQIREHFAAIGCGFIVEKDSLSFGQYKKKVEFKDSVDNAIYAKGCAFKTSYFQGSYFEAGRHEMDVRSESFACDLRSRNIDTILLIKSFYNNHGLGNSNYSAIFWIENSLGKMKIFQRKEFDIFETKEIKIDLGEILTYFFDKKIPEIKTQPQPQIRMSHDLTYYIQFLVKDKYYIDSLTYYEMTGDKVHEKSIWWTMINKLIEYYR